MLARIAIITGLATCAMSCQRFSDSAVVGEWTERRLDAVDHVTYLTDHVTYRADHTWVRRFEDPRRSVINQSGTWRINGHEMICQDNEQRETQAEILQLTRDHLQVRPPDAR
jgi:hypothetical protein